MQIFVTSKLKVLVQDDFIFAKRFCKYWEVNYFVSATKLVLFEENKIKYPKRKNPTFIKKKIFAFHVMEF